MNFSLRALYLGEPVPWCSVSPHDRIHSRQHSRQYFVQWVRSTIR